MSLIHHENTQTQHLNQQNRIYYLCVTCKIKNITPQMNKCIMKYTKINQLTLDKNGIIKNKAMEHYTIQMEQLHTKAIERLINLMVRELCIMKIQLILIGELIIDLLMNYKIIG